MYFEKTKVFHEYTSHLEANRGVIRHNNKKVRYKKMWKYSVFCLGRHLKKINRPVMSITSGIQQLTSNVYGGKRGDSDSKSRAT